MQVQSNQQQPIKSQTRRYAVNNEPSLTYCDNSVKSTRTNALTFIPVNLFGQLQSMANLYFIAISILQMIPSISVTNGTPTTLFPLAFVMIVVLIKDAYQEFCRYLKDKQQNQKQIQVWNGSNFNYQSWQSLRVGNVVKVKKQQFVACDILVIKTSDPQNKSYVQTKGLDGQTNLKMRQSFLNNIPNSLSKDDSSFRQKYEFSYSQPSQAFAQFDGVATFKGVQIPLDSNNLLLRGCILKNTLEVVGVCLFTGQDTKLVKNSGAFLPKKSKLMSQINSLVLWIFCVQFVIALICAMMNLLLQDSYKALFTWIPQSSFWIKTFTWWLLMTYFIPISLMVTMQMVKLFQGIVLSKDRKGFSPSYDCFTTASNTSVNENLGQIKYVFTDKTGTLTKNNMMFRNIIIGGQLYDKKDEPMKAQYEQFRTSVNFRDSKFRQKKDNNPQLQEAIKLLSLCHQIYVQTEGGKRIYNSGSPDEIALIQFCKMYDKQLLGQKNGMIEIVSGQGSLKTILKYEKLAVLGFNSVRKRMSVIVRDPTNNQIILYTKGADSTVVKLLRSGQRDLPATQRIITDLSVTGLRTLMLGRKRLSPEQYSRWNSEMLRAKGLLGEQKKEALDKCYEKIQQNLQLVGATAIQDELQDDVANTITQMRAAGMSFFILTGDKRETAINIGKSCGLVNPDALLLDIPPFESMDVDEWKKHMFELKAKKEDKVFLLNAEGKIPPELPLHQTICYRCTPKNKAKIVQTVKQGQQFLTMAVGDGANDVNMITQADVGVGIRGKEGTQAARVADFVAGQFKFIKLLTVYYGREWYRKNCELALYSFWKNWMHVTSVVIYGGLSYFSGVVIYNVYLYELFNVIYSGWPIIIWAVFDQQYTFKQSCRQPQKYKKGVNNEHFNQSTFLTNVGLSIGYGVLGMVIVFVGLQASVLSTDGATGHLKLSGSVLFGAYVMIVNFRILVMSTGVKPFILVICLFSIIIYWPSEAIAAKFFHLPDMNNLVQQWSYAPVIFVQLIILFFFVLVEFGYKKFIRIKDDYRTFGTYDFAKMLMFRNTK